MKYEQFHRTLLLFGENAFQKLQQSHIAVIGCGAVGSFACEALARAGIGHITLVDGDDIQETNINRQICATHHTIGQKKTSVLSERIYDICPKTKVSVHNDFVRNDNFNIIFQDKPDFVIDAIDVLQDKTDLIIYLQEQKIPFISSMGAALKTNPTQIQIAPLNQTSVCPLAARLRKLLKDRQADLSFPCIFSTEKPTGQQEKGRQMGSLVTITGIFGLIAANEAIHFILRTNNID